MQETVKGITGEGLTVAICVKNGGRTIAEAVGSLCNQTVPPARIIIIDDGSTDNTRAEIERVASEGCRIEVVPNKGAGLYDGRNTALGLCHTEFLAFIDADCIADRDWAKGLLTVFAEHPEVAAGTGSHPQHGEANLVSSLHRLWFVVEGHRGTGYTGGVVGANSYFRTSVLRGLGGWISLPLGNAEDFYISIKMGESGHKIWFEEGVKVFHYYATDFGDFIKKTYKSGYAITILMRKARWRNYWYYYTLSIPVVAFFTLFGLILGIVGISAGWALLVSILFGTFLFNLKMFKTVMMTLPRWAVRWVIIWGYSLGIVRALFTRI